MTHLWLIVPLIMSVFAWWAASDNAYLDRGDKTLVAILLVLPSVVAGLLAVVARG